MAICSNNSDYENNTKNITNLTNDLANKITQELILFKDISYESGTIGTRGCQYEVQIGNSSKYPISAQIAYTSDSSSIFPLAFLGKYNNITLGSLSLYLNGYRTKTSAVSGLTVYVLITYLNV